MQGLERGRGKGKERGGVGEGIKRLKELRRVRGREVHTQGLECSRRAAKGRDVGRLFLVKGRRYIFLESFETFLGLTWTVYNAFC